MLEKEVRCLMTADLRAQQDENGGAVIEGYPIVFNQETDLGGGVREMILPEAVSDEKLLRDVALMVGHDFGMIPLAHSRRNNGSATMTLTPDDHGVRMRAVLDVERNPRAMEAYSAIRRGDISGMSFAFVVDKKKEDWEGADSDSPLRKIRGFSRIFEVSLVAFPAYEGTSVQAASEGCAPESVMASLESERQRLREDREAQAAAERRRALWERLENLQKEVRTNEPE